jgi:hypothetical protein
MKTLGQRTIVQVSGRMVGQLYLDRDRDHRRTVFLAGSGRSGTTWVADIINYRNDHRYIFEPFHRHRVRACRKFGYRQYIRPGDTDPEFLEAATRIVTGRLRNLYADQHNRQRMAHRRLVKEVRANLFLKWLNSHFPGMPMVLLLRHPCGVASSRLKVDWTGGADLRQLLAQPQLLEDHLEPFRAELAQTEDRFERMVYFWCIENVVPLRQFSPGEIHVMFYEHLCLEPEAEIERLLTFLGRGYDAEALKTVARPSSATRTDSAVISGEDLVAAWRKHVPQEQVSRAMEILARFGLDAIYSEDPVPILRGSDDALAVLGATQETP